MKNITKAKRLKGFPDFFEQDVKIREYVIGVFKEVFEKYGYEPLETPALELSEMMLGISGEEAEKQFYRFTDPGGRDVMLKYEVMVSMCRAVAENINNIQFPYKRYQIQKVWRAENTQKGRYREFTQCDADTIGSNSVFCDAEFIQMGLEVVQRLGFKEYIARISNRKFLDGVAKYIGISDEKFYDFCISLDKLKKIGKDKVVEEMEKRGIEKEKAVKALSILNAPLEKQMSFTETLESFKDVLKDIPVGKEALDELSQINQYLIDAKVNKELYVFDTSLARGLASYTGPVWEFEVIDGGVGSIAGCGRYDKLIEKYIGRSIPATGGSFGIERVCDIMKERKMIDIKGVVDVMFVLFSTDFQSDLLDIARGLRDKNISVMIYPEEESLKAQLRYASEKGIPFVGIYGEEEKKKGVVKIKNMKERTEEEVSTADVNETILSLK